MFRQALTPSIRSATKATTQRRVLLGGANFSTSTRVNASKASTAQPGTTDDSIKRKFPNTPTSKQHQGPEFIKGDEGSHGQRTLKSFSMTGKTCVVTGACSGLGNLMARALVESGANQLAILDLKQSAADSAAKEMTKWIESEGAVNPGEVDIRGFACDVADESSVVKAFKGVKDAFGKVDTVINSAGIVENFPAIEYPTDRLLKVSECGFSNSNSALLNPPTPPALHARTALRYQRLWLSLCLTRSSQNHDRLQDRRKHHPHRIHVRLHRQYPSTTSSIQCI